MGRRSRALAHTHTRAHTCSCYRKPLLPDELVLQRLSRWRESRTNRARKHVTLTIADLKL